MGLSTDTDSRLRTDKRTIIQHIINLWNLLVDDRVMAIGLDIFKRGFDKLMKSKAVECYKQ